jgi:exopolysaccharide biosynthesis WecB/TagA/CpsF family protein
MKIDLRRNPNNQERTYEQILGVRFFVGNAAQAVENFLRKGGYIAVPASTALIKLSHDDDYGTALRKADLVLPDSGLLVGLWRTIGGRKLWKISGVAYLKCLLDRDDVWSGTHSFWVVPSESAKIKAIQWLTEKKLEIKPENFYVAERAGGPGEYYPILVEIEKQQPKHVVIALGAGTQEKLGLYLRESLLCQPAIHCVGAALGFLSGYEHRIPEWAERFYLGWLLRLVQQPRMLLPRLGIACVVAWMVIKYRSESPLVKARWSEL